MFSLYYRKLLPPSWPTVLSWDDMSLNSGKKSDNDENTAGADVQ